MSHSHLIIHTDKERTGDTRVLKVVQGCRDQTAHVLQIVQLKLVLHSTADSEVIEGLADIGRMRLIVIRDVLVSVGESFHEGHQPAELEFARADQALLGEDVGEQRLKLFALRVLAKSEYVEFVRINLLQFFFGAFGQVEHQNDHLLGQLGPKLRVHSGSDVDLVGIECAIVFKAASLLLGKLHVPGLHAVFQVDCHDGRLLLLIAGTVLAVGRGSNPLALVALEVEVLLVKLVLSNHLNAVL